MILREEKHRQLRTGVTNRLHVHYIRGKPTNPLDSEPGASHLPYIQHCRLADMLLLNNVTSFFVAVGEGGFHSSAKTLYI
jgi:hypothetical protein